MNPTHPNVTPVDSDEQEVETAPMWLKVLVIVLGLAIIGMLALILYKIAVSDGDKASVQLPPAGSVDPVLTPDLNEGPEALRLDLPAGTQIVSMTPYGRELFFQVRHSDGAQAVYILNRLTGAISRIEVTSAGS